MNDFCVSPCRVQLMIKYKCAWFNENWWVLSFSILYNRRYFSENIGCSCTKASAWLNLEPIWTKGISDNNFESFIDGARRGVEWDKHELQLITTGRNPNRTSRQLCTAHIYASLVWPMDYRRKDGRFPVSASCVTISNSNSLSSSKTEFNPWRRSWKTLIWMSVMSKSRWWYLFRKEVKSWDLTTWFRNWQFQTPAWSVIFKCISRLNGSFLGDDRGFVKEGVELDLSIGTNSIATIILASLFFSAFTSIIYHGHGTLLSFSTWCTVPY